MASTAVPPDAPTWPTLYTSLLAGHDLSAGEAAWAMDQVMRGEATPVQVAGFLMALRAKGESVSEMRGLADMMLQHATRIEAPDTALDIVGTGGDRAHTVNISTMASIVCAGAGVPVIKHGNRAASSSSGSADVLESLGINLRLTPEQVADVYAECGISFCFAQTFHPSFRHTAEARRDLGIGTAFNFLGPLTNPAQPRYAAVGVADERMAPLIAGVFAQRGKDAAVFRGDDGLDELTISTTSSLWWVRDAEVTRHRLDPARLGLALHPVESLRGRDADYNAGVLREVLGGTDRGPVRDAVVLNAGLALALTQPDVGDREDTDALHRQVRAGMDRAQESIDSGAARDVVARWVAASTAQG
jgi:anthranilate phosphoribosyltransferase